MDDNIFQLDEDDQPIHITEEQYEGYQDAAYHIAKKVSDHQISTQNKVVYISANEGTRLTPVIKDVMTIMGEKCYINPSMTLLKIYGLVSSSYVLTGIQMVKPIVIEIHNKVSHLTITNCKNIIIKITNTSFAGIECINSKKINLSVKSINFVRVTTSEDVKMTGEIDKVTVLDIRNSINIVINTDLIPGCLFNEARFRYKKGILSKINEDDDIFSSGNLSLPNLTLLKLYK
jgi:hypothetical protein